MDFEATSVTSFFTTVLQSILASEDRERERERESKPCERDGKIEEEGEGDSEKGRERKITLKKERESKCVKQSRGSKGKTLKTSS